MEELAPENEKKHVPCSGLRKELKDCITSSDCVLKKSGERGFHFCYCAWTIYQLGYGHSPKECLQAQSEGVNNDCRLTQQAFFECKRSLLDFRNRFRGRKGY